MKPNKEMLCLRDMLDAAGIEWHDNSDETTCRTQLYEGDDMVYSAICGRNTFGNIELWIRNARSCKLGPIGLNNAEEAFELISRGDGQMTSVWRLSSMLDEHGIEYDNESYLGSVFWSNASYEQFRDGHTRLIVDDATPEQAIAATVGAQDGTIDMDWVRDLVERHSDHIEGNGRAFHNGAYARMAEEIAATVGVGTCQGEIDIDYFECKLTTFECRKCGWSGVVDNIYPDYSFDGTDMPRHCPNCGAKVVSK